MKLNALQTLAVIALLSPLAASAGTAIDVEIRDRESGRTLPVYWHDGERYVAGEPGQEYEIRLRNRAGGRVLAVTSVDGVNVITGRTATPRQSGYVLDPWGAVDIDGWRKSMDEVAAFYFTDLPDSYAARTGRPDNVGVIGVALFREKPAYRQHWSLNSAAETAAAPASATKSAGAVAERSRDESRLGTGHGRRLDSGATYTHFERASDEPDEIIRIYYDSRRNLVAQGVIPRPYGWFARRAPDPFPPAFVPDP